MTAIQKSDWTVLSVFSSNSLGEQEQIRPMRRSCIRQSHPTLSMSKQVHFVGRLWRHCQWRQSHCIGKCKKHDFPYRISSNTCRNVNLRNWSAAASRDRLLVFSCPLLVRAFLSECSLLDLLPAARAIKCFFRLCPES